MRRAYALFILVLVGLLFVGAVVVNTAYTRHVQEQADRRWCSLLNTLDQPSVPVTTERGRIVQKQIHQLRAQLGCGRQ